MSDRLPAASWRSQRVIELIRTFLLRGIVANLSGLWTILQGSLSHLVWAASRARSLGVFFEKIFLKVTYFSDSPNERIEASPRTVSAFEFRLAHEDFATKKRKSSRVLLYRRRSELESMIVV